jgi:hypothetical protein
MKFFSSACIARLTTLPAAIFVTIVAATFSRIGSKKMTKACIFAHLSVKQPVDNAAHFGDHDD